MFPTGIGNQLKQVAKLIKIKDTLGMKRQIFSARLVDLIRTGETSADQRFRITQVLGNLLTQFSQAARAVYDEMGAETATASRYLRFPISDAPQPSGSGAVPSARITRGAVTRSSWAALFGGTFCGTYPRSM